MDAVSNRVRSSSASPARPLDPALKKYVRPRTTTAIDTPGAPSARSSAAASRIAPRIEARPSDNIAASPSPRIAPRHHMESGNKTRSRLLSTRNLALGLS